MRNGVREEADFDDAGDPCSHQGISKDAVHHSRDHQGLGVIRHRPPSEDDATRSNELEDRFGKKESRKRT